MNNKYSRNKVIGIIFAFIILFSIFNSYFDNTENKLMNKKDSNSLNIISSSENQDLEDIIVDYAKSKGYKINIEYAGTLEIMQKLNNGEKYDALWLSNSIWMYMLDSSISTSNSKCTSINPVIFAIKKSKAQELDFINKTVYTQDIVNAISDGKLKFSMPNPTTTNSGASAYLGLLYTLAGNPEVLKKEDLSNSELREKLTTLFTGLERSSGSESFLEELFLNGDYEAVVTYESSIININKQLVGQKKEPLYAIYPIDGVSISDSPFAFINNDNENKKEIFEDIQSYVLSNQGQKLLQEKGRRTWFGGISQEVDEKIFNPSWGIDTKKYISPVKYPSTAVIKDALNLYQTELRKPVHVVFCLDYSGSMSGTGYEELMNAMDYILTEKAANDFIQFSERDKIDVVPFSSDVYSSISTTNGRETESLLLRIHAINPNGRTALYPAAIRGLTLVQNEESTYNSSIILMTDGQANVGEFKDLRNKYLSVKKDIPIYSIMFGNAVKSELDDIADLTNAKVFDGKIDLVKAFKEVRGYN